jgi:hypothetical protein
MPVADIVAGEAVGGERAGDDDDDRRGDGDEQRVLDVEQEVLVVDRVDVVVERRGEQEARRRDDVRIIQAMGKTMKPSTSTIRP